MRLLFLTPALPHPPQQGTAIRNWGLIAGLAPRHEITLLTFAAPGAHVTPELRAACARVESVPPPIRSTLARLRTLLLTRAPDLALRLESSEYRSRLASLLRENIYAAVHVEGLEMGPYVDTLRAARPRPLIIYDAHNAESVIQRRAFDTDVRQPGRWPAAAYSRLQLPRLARFERAVCRGADRVLAVSGEDAAAIRRLDPASTPVLVPNGLFLEDYDPDKTTGSLPPAALVFTGKMDYRPNVDAAQWFAREVFPLVQASEARAQLFIVGKQPLPAVQRLGQLPGVHVTGQVDDVRPYIASAAVYVAPLRMGGGTRFKLLEAFALRKAVVSTRVGAEGFEVESGRELLLADTPRALASAIIDLLANEARRAALGAAGRAFVEANYDWARILPTVEDVYQAAA